MEHNAVAWERKPLLRELYAGFYRKIVDRIDPAGAGQIAEIGSGIGNLREHLPGAMCTDLFMNPWLDVVCDGYELPFADASLSHLVLFDVFHHLQWPSAFLAEARRAVRPDGRVLLFEPYISAASVPVYGLLHHEPVAWRAPIELRPSFPHDRTYYAAQGNATRLFFRSADRTWLDGWNVEHLEAFSTFAYLLSGGYSKPAMYPARALNALLRVDAALSRWPRLFGGRCLIELRRASD
jgi:SAM-dependent methyltransferase